jgi:hypothetical protein
MSRKGQLYLNRLAINVDGNMPSHAFYAEPFSFDVCNMIIFEKAARCKTASNSKSIGS